MASAARNIVLQHYKKKLSEAAFIAASGTAAFGAISAYKNGDCFPENFTLPVVNADAYGNYERETNDYNCQVENYPQMEDYSKRDRKRMTKKNKNSAGEHSNSRVSDAHFYLTLCNEHY